MSLIHYEKDYNNLSIQYYKLANLSFLFGPIFEEAGEKESINFIKIDVDKHPEIAREYGVMTIPTIILFNNGKEVKRYTGFMSKDELIKFINE